MLTQVVVARQSLQSVPVRGAAIKLAHVLMLIPVCISAALCHSSPLFAVL